jgi:hypothetical protein
VIEPRSANLGIFPRFSWVKFGRRDNTMNGNKQGYNKVLLHTLSGLAFGVVVGIFIYAVTGQIYYLLVTAAFGLVSGAGVDAMYEESDLPGRHSSR